MVQDPHLQLLQKLEGVEGKAGYHAYHTVQGAINHGRQLGCLAVCRLHHQAAVREAVDLVAQVEFPHRLQQ